MTEHNELLDDMTGAELIKVHNDLADRFEDVERIKAKKWSKAKSILIERIMELRQSVQDLEIIQETEDENAAVWLDQKGSTIKETCLNLLCFERGKGEDGRTYGYSYYEILEIVRRLHPGCKTSAACLRWYAVKVRAEEHGYEGRRLVQRRPRSVSKKSGG